VGAATRRAAAAMRRAPTAGSRLRTRLCVGSPRWAARGLCTAPQPPPASKATDSPSPPAEDKEPPKPKFVMIDAWPVATPNRGYISCPAGVQMLVERGFQVRATSASAAARRRCCWPAAVSVAAAASCGDDAAPALACTAELLVLGVRGGTQGQDSFSRVVDGGTEGTSFTAIPLLEQIPFTISTA
jgi:hypothetical protein